MVAGIQTAWAGSADVPLRDSVRLVPAQTKPSLMDVDEDGAPRDPVPISLHFGVGFLGGLVGSAAGTYIGVGLGSLSNTLLGALIPVLIAQVFVAPFVTVLAAWIFGNAMSPHRFQFWAPWGVALLFHAAALVVASVIGVAWLDPLAMFLYTVIDAFVMSGTSVTLIRILAAREPVRPIQSFVPNVSDTQFVSLGTVRF